MTRGRCGSLLLHRDGLAPSTPCRSPGALRSTPINGHRQTGPVGPFRARSRHGRRSSFRAPNNYFADCETFHVRSTRRCYPARAELILDELDNTKDGGWKVRRRAVGLPRSRSCAYQALRKDQPPQCARFHTRAASASRRRVQAGHARHAPNAKRNVQIPQRADYALRAPDVSEAHGGDICLIQRPTQ